MPRSSTVKLSSTHIVAACFLIFILIALVGRTGDRHVGEVVPRALTPENAPHVVLAFDDSPRYYPLMIATISSLVRNSEASRWLHLHLLSLRHQRERAEMFASSLRNRTGVASVNVGCPTVLHATQGFKEHGLDGSLINELNVAHHFYLADAFPDLERCVVIDTDVLVLKSIESLWLDALDRFESTSTRDGERAMVAAAPHPSKKISRYLNMKARENKEKYPYDALSFGTGIMVLDLSEWRRRDITARLWNVLEQNRIYHERYMKEHNLSKEEAAHRSDSYRYRAVRGTRPLMNLVFYESYVHLSPYWNVGDACMLDALPNGTNILHFSGAVKPPDKECKEWALELWKSFLT